MTGATILTAIAYGCGLFALATAVGLLAALCLCAFAAWIKPREDAGDCYADWLADEFTPEPFGSLVGDGQSVAPTYAQLMASSHIRANNP
jgi:hypothetical protein